MVGLNDRFGFPNQKIIIITQTIDVFEPEMLKRSIWTHQFWNYIIDNKTRQLYSEYAF